MSHMSSIVKKMYYKQIWIKQIQKLLDIQSLKC